MEQTSTDPLSAANRRRRLSPELRVDGTQSLSAVVKVEFGAHSRTGPTRALNEDHFLIARFGRYLEVLGSTLSSADLPERFDEYGYAMVVADGAGKQGSGAVASRVAVSTLAHLAVKYGNWNLRLDARAAESVVDKVEWFYELAARAVTGYSLSDSALSGMRTTLTAAYSAGDDLFYSHVGHSRAYLFRDGQLTQLTKDHTVEQRLIESPGPVPLPAGAHDLGHILTDAIGAGNGPPTVDVERFRLRDGDMILLCTDGLTAVVDDESIADLLAHPRSLDDQCRQLVDLAFSRGTDDDATVILAKYQIPSP